MQTLKLGFNPIYNEQNPSIEEISIINGLVLLEFGNAWCGHCQAAEPVVKQLLTDTQLHHIKLADGKGKRLGRAFKVKQWPTLILLDTGDELARVVRPLTMSDVKPLLAKMKPNG